MAKMVYLLEIMSRLRDPEAGCPWDLRQTWASIAPYTLEEAYEVVDAIDRGDASDLCDELGDLLLQVVFHARIAEEAGAFDFADVVEGLTDKLVRRHPHVFDRSAPSPMEAGAPGSWEAIKADERASKAAASDTPLAGVARTLPALRRAQKLQKRAVQLGVAPDDGAGHRTGLEADLDRALGAAQAGPASEGAQALGDLLFALAAWARQQGLDAEEALRQANRRFETDCGARRAESPASALDRPPRVQGATGPSDPAV
jgi:ATP diphosphatase